MKKRKVSKPKVKSNNKYYDHILNQEMNKIKNLREGTHNYRSFHNGNFEKKVSIVLTRCMDEIQDGTYDLDEMVKIDNYLKQAIIKELKIFLNDYNLSLKEKTNTMTVSHEIKSDLDDFRLKVKISDDEMKKRNREKRTNI